MEPITKNEFLNSVLEAEAWKEISQSESLILVPVERNGRDPYLKHYARESGDKLYR